MLNGGGTTTGALGAFGFQIPQGNPGELDAAAGACSTWASGLTGRAGAVRRGAATAMAGWNGSAESNFAALSSHVESVYDTLGGTVASAGKTLSRFAQELEMAQRVTKQALQECETYSQQVTSAQQEAAAHAQTAQDLSARAATAVHPAQQAELSRQLSSAQNAQASAEKAASSAQGELDAAKRRGMQAWSTYEQQAQAVAQALQGLAGQIEKAGSMPGGGGAPGTAGGFYWPTLGGVIGSKELDGTIGLAEGLMKRYRSTDLVLPITQSANNDLAEIAGKVAGNGDQFTMAGGIWVPKGGSADPLVQQIQETTSGENWAQGRGPLLVPNEGDLEAAAPGWSSALGKGLGVAGVGLTFYSTGAEQWQYDQEHHPNWSTAQKVADTAQSTAVVGGLTAGGAWAGATAGATTGAEGGAAIGEAIFPAGGGIVGGAIGGIGGGIVGGIVGGGVGQAIGHTAEHVGSDIGHAASSLWNDIF